MSATRDAVEGFGPHLVFDGYGCSADRLHDLDRIYTLLDSLPGRVRMTKIMPPYVFRHATPGRGGDGISGFVLIAESHIAVHTFPQRHFLNADLFSCQTFDVELVLAALKETFAPRRVDWRLLDRGLEFPRTIGPARASMLEDRALVARDLELEVLR
jgi:S-adenosylmethionine decarboxylase